MTFGVDGDQFLWRIEWDATDSKSSYRVSRIVKNFKSRQCMSRVVTNSGRQRFRVTVNGASLSDDLKRNGQGRNPRIREERAVPTAGKRAVPTAGNDVNLWWQWEDWSAGQSCNPAKRSLGDYAASKRMRRKCEVETPTCSDFGEDCEKWSEEDDGGRCARTLPDDISGSEQEDALAWQTEIKDEIKAVHRHHDEGEGKFPSWSVVSKSNWCWCDQFAEENQQKLEEKAVENQTEDEVESHVDEAMESQNQRTRFRWWRRATRGLATSSSHRVEEHGRESTEGANNPHWWVRPLGWQQVSNSNQTSPQVIDML